MSIQWNVVTWYSKLLAIVVFVAAFILGGYVGMQYQLTKDQPVMQSQAWRIAQLQPSAPTPIAPVVLQNQKLLTLTAPAAGAILCRGAKIKISWSAEKPVDRVRIWLDAPTPAGAFGEYPVTWNDSGVVGMGEIIWTVGESQQSPLLSFPDGDTYRIHIDALSGTDTVESAKSGLFSIQTCEG